jgi:HlyD family secretion protein
VRPGFTCTAEIVTSTKAGAVAVPIQALTVRELLYDPSGAIVPEPESRSDDGESMVDSSSEPPPGHTRKETEGVFTFVDGRAVFTPVTVGIAGERYFEVRSGLSAGDRVITGPFSSVRGLADGGDVRIAQTTSSSAGQQ